MGPVIMVILALLVILAVIVLISCISIVPQANAYVVERLGRYYDTYTYIYFCAPRSLPASLKRSV